MNPNAREQMRLAQFLEKKIAENRKGNRMAWAICGSGAVGLLTGMVLANVELFLVCGGVIFAGSLATRHFEDRIDKLQRLKRRVII